jgi:hypothetical protein
MMAAKRHNVVEADILFFKNEENTKEYNKYPQICIAVGRVTQSI